MKKIHYFSLLLISIISALFVYNFSTTNRNVHAVSGADWRAGNIISDSIFTNNDALSVQDIQNFLNSKIGTCDVNGTQPATEYGHPELTHAQYAASRGWQGPPYTCLNMYYEVPKTEPGGDMPANNYSNPSSIPTGAQSAAWIIKDAANRYNISPKVLLVKLGTESPGPLTSDSWPLYNQYKYAMGSHCPDSGPGGSANCDPAYAGFSIQMYSAASLLRWYLDSMTQSWWTYKKPYQTNDILWNVVETGCGSGSVYIESKATAALYTYTPYQPNQAALNNMYGTGDGCSAYGNRNFWRTYSDWFGSPNGTFIVRSSSDPTYYLLTNNTRYAIPNSDILYAYGLQDVQLTFVSDTWLNAIPKGGTLSTIFTVPGDPTVYLADNGRKYGIPSAIYCSSWGLACGDTSVRKELSADMGNRLTSGGTLGLVASRDGIKFLMQDGKKRPFYTEKSIVENGYGNEPVVPVVNWTNAIRPYGLGLPENNSVVKFGSSNAIYIFANNNFYLVPSITDFNQWVTAGTTQSYDKISAFNQLPTPVTSILKPLVVFGDGKTYLVDNGRKLDLSALGTSWPNAANLAGLATYANRFSAATVQQTNTMRLPSGEIYLLKNQKKSPFNSVRDYYSLGYTEQNLINLSGTNALSGIDTGPTLLAEGTAFKKSGDTNTIYLVARNNNVYSLGSPGQIAQFNISTQTIATIDAQSFGQFTYRGPLTSGVKDEAGNVFLILDGTARLSVSSAVASAWGYNVQSTPLFSSSYLSQWKIVSNLSNFGRQGNGVIFYGQSGAKHAISSYDKFKSLGGTSSNTPTLPQDFFDACPTGPPV